MRTIAENELARRKLDILVTQVLHGWNTYLVRKSTYRNLIASVLGNQGSSYSIFNVSVFSPCLRWLSQRMRPIPFVSFRPYIHIVFKTQSKNDGFRGYYEKKIYGFLAALFKTTRTRNFILEVLY